MLLLNNCLFFLYDEVIWYDYSEVSYMCYMLLYVLLSYFFYIVIL